MILLLMPSLNVDFLAASVSVRTEADSQRAPEAQVHHTLHQENGLSDRADRPLPSLEVRGARGGIKL